MAKNQLASLQRLVGSWTTEVKHRLMPGEVTRGTATFAWLPGEKFLVWDSRTENPKFPIGHAIIGFLDEDRVGDDGSVATDADAKLTLQYYDSRGVYRVYDFTIDDAEWTQLRKAEGFSQRSRTTFVGNDTMELVGQLDQGQGWVDDIWIAFRRK